MRQHTGCRKPWATKEACWARKVDENDCSAESSEQKESVLKSKSRSRLILEVACGDDAAVFEKALVVPCKVHTGQGNMFTWRDSMVRVPL